MTKCRNGRQFDGEVAAVSARAQRFTIEWHDGSTEKVSERRLKALLKPPPRVPDLRYLRSSKRESSYPSSEPRIGPLYQATLPAGPPSPPDVPPQPAAPACSSGQEDLPPQKRLCGEPPGAHTMESSGRLDLRTSSGADSDASLAVCERGKEIRKHTWAWPWAAVMRPG